MFNTKGNSAIIALVISLVIGVILLIGVLVPITQSTVTTGNFTGVNSTIANNLVTFILIGVLVLVAGIAIFGMSRK
jgi:hypothetical protein